MSFVIEFQSHEDFLMAKSSENHDGNVNNFAHTFMCENGHSTHHRSDLYLGHCTECGKIAVQIWENEEFPIEF